MEPKEKKAFEPSGLVPRSIVRTFERFRQQLLPGSETAAIREYRISRYQVLVSARCLFTLLVIPIATNWLVSSWLVSPLVEHFWNTQQNEIFLNSYQEERAFAELESFSEKLFFESLLNTTNAINVDFTPYLSAAYDPASYYSTKMNSIGVSTARQAPHSFSRICHPDRGQHSEPLTYQPSLISYIHFQELVTPSQLLLTPSCAVARSSASLVKYTSPSAPALLAKHYSQPAITNPSQRFLRSTSKVQQGKPLTSAALTFISPRRACEAEEYQRYYLPRGVSTASEMNVNAITNPSLLRRGDKFLKMNVATLGKVQLVKEAKGSDASLSSGLFRRFFYPYGVAKRRSTTSKALTFIFKNLSPPASYYSTKMNPIGVSTARQAPTGLLYKSSICNSRQRCASKESTRSSTEMNPHSFSRTCHSEGFILMEGLNECGVLVLEQGMTYDNSLKTKEKVQNKILELAVYYNQQTIISITNIVGDIVSLVTLGCLFIWMKPEITILKSFLIEAIYSLSDTTKSFLLILLTDLLVGFHSPRGWETALELLLKHFGLPENQDFVFLFVATFPVLLDTVFKYWIFRHLNKISPSTVATYHSMIE